MQNYKKNRLKFLTHFIVIFFCTIAIISYYKENKALKQVIDNSKNMVKEMEIELDKEQTLNQSNNDKYLDVIDSNKILKDKYDRLENNYEDEFAKVNELTQNRLFFKREEFSEVEYYGVMEKLSIKSLPYQDSITINEVKSGSVKVISNIVNNDDEKWCLVEYTHPSNSNYNVFGYIASESINNFILLENSTQEYKIDIDIDTLKIGDTLEKVISIYGRKFIYEKNEIEWSINYEGVKVLISSDIERIIGFSLTDISVNIDGKRYIGEDLSKLMGTFEDKYDVQERTTAIPGEKCVYVFLNDMYVLKAYVNEKDIVKQIDIDIFDGFFD